MNRRGFLGSILASCTAPAIVRVDSLMRILARDTLVFHPDAFSLVTPGIVGKEALRIMAKSFQFAEHVNQAWRDEFKYEGPLRIIRPAHYGARA